MKRNSIHFQRCKLIVGENDDRVPLHIPHAGTSICKDGSYIGLRYCRVEFNKDGIGGPGVRNGPGCEGSGGPSSFGWKGLWARII